MLLLLTKLQYVLMLSAQSRKAEMAAKTDFDAHNTLLLEELPRLYDSRVDYFQPSLQAYTSAQVTIITVHWRICTFTWLLDRKKDAWLGITEQIYSCCIVEHVTQKREFELYYESRIRVRDTSLESGSPIPSM